MKLRYLVTLLVAAVALLSNAATYYVSPNGDDTNSGTSAGSAWKTIARVNQTPFTSGDKVLFQKGATFRGKIKAYYNGITYGTYGTGAKPIIAGSRQVTGWTIHSGNIWKTVLAGPITNIFCQGQLMTLARFPNTGWFRNNVGSTSTLNSLQLTQPNGYWTGAQAVIRSTVWSYDVVTVTNYTNGTISFAPFPSGYDLQNYDWGFYMQNKLSELDTAGEWYFDSTTSTLYFWAPNNANPNLLLVEAMGAITSGESGVLVGWLKTGVKIVGLDFRQHSYAGVENSGGYQLVVDSCTFQYNFVGVKSYTNLTSGFDNIVVTNCLITKNFESGVKSVGVGHRYENNELLYNSIFPGQGVSGWGYITMDTYNNNTVIKKNRVIGSGYIGVTVRGNSLVEQNFIDSSCTILNDGCGMGPDESDGAIFRDNIILRTIGSTGGSCAPDWSGCTPKGKGIYFGNLSVKNTLIENNTVAYCNGAGMWVDHTMASTGNIIRNNTFFDNNLYQIGFSDFSNYSGPAAVAPYAVASYNQTITNNIFYCKNASQRTMYHINRWYSGVDFGTFTNNKHHNPWNQVTIEKLDFVSNTNPTYTLTQWQQSTNDEIGSTSSPFNLTGNNGVNDHILVYNDKFNQQSVPLPTGTWSDLDGNIFFGSIILDPFRSRVLYRLPVVTLSINIFLQGPYNGGTMSDALRALNMIPLSDPYPALGYVHVGGAGATTSFSTLTTIGNNAIIDWILVEIRSAASPTQRIYTTAALLQRDGDIVATDGVSPLTIPVAPNSYYVAVKHRNHLGAMTASPISLGSNTILNFNTTPTYGIDAMYVQNGTKMLWAGDVTFDGILKYTGTNNDKDPILSRIGGNIPTTSIDGYFQEDVNMSGVVKYTGSENDRDIILFNIGGTVPTNTKTQQIP